MLGMSSDTKWIVGTVITVALGLAALILQQSNQLQNRISGIDARLRTVEQVQAQHSVKLDQQGEILQRLADRELGTATLANI